MPRPLATAIPQQAPEPVARIFVIDDDPVVRRLMASMLRSSYQEVREFACARDALRALQVEPADAVVVDVILPDMDGLQFLDRLSGEDLSVVVVSALQGVDTVVEAIRRGAADFLAKPVRRDRLLASVRRAVEWTRLKRRVAALETRLRSVAIRGSGPAPTPVPAPSEPRTSSFPDLQTLEQRAIERALRYTNGNVSEAARRLGIGRTTLYRKMATYGLAPAAG